RAALHEAVRAILAEVRARGDAALLDCTARFDRVRLQALQVASEELAAAAQRLDPEDRAAIDAAIATVTRFHEAQRSVPLTVDTAPGVRCERLTRPIDAVGLYVPAGGAPLPSTAIMLAVPARLAGCRVRVLCTPPRADGSADPAVLYAARACGVGQVFTLGGAQAIAALAYGTATVPRVDKVFGPGNAWVTAAKQLVAVDPEGAASDLPAGPSEVLIVADAGARADFIAADLLAQAEHSSDAQVLLVTDSRELAGRVNAELARQLPLRRRAAVAGAALAHGRAIVTTDLATAIEVANAYAPEHLLIQTRAPRDWLEHVTRAGSVFLGPWTPEVLGDYCSGTNHVLPTWGYARSCSGLALADFERRMTVQEADQRGLATLGPVAVRLARLEGLEAHAEAMAVRLRAAEAGT
ncbi:MAG: histidinol dehydrogenase, partial [Gammaproteobacteria bacterium]|nr:histidinol dehydrogenase [Gammaproteobacteria bacterium]